MWYHTLIDNVSSTLKGSVTIADGPRDAVNEHGRTSWKLTPLLSQYKYLAVISLNSPSSSSITFMTYLILWEYIRDVCPLVVRHRWRCRDVDIPSAIRSKNCRRPLGMNPYARQLGKSPPKQHNYLGLPDGNADLELIRIHAKTKPNEWMHDW